MMKKSKYGYHRVKREVSHKLQLAEKEYISKVLGKQHSNILDPGKY
jgi:hypothetical protein